MAAPPPKGQLPTLEIVSARSNGPFTASEVNNTRRQVEIGHNQHLILRATCDRLDFIAAKVKNLDPQQLAAQAESSAKQAAAAARQADSEAKKAGAAAEVVHAAGPILTKLDEILSLQAAMDGRLQALEAASQQKKSCCTVM
jgi:hypothetical protein